MVGPGLGGSLGENMEINELGPGRELDAFIKAHKENERNAKCPDNLWIPGFGWVLRNGEPTETAQEYLKSLDKK